LIPFFVACFAFSTGVCKAHPRTAPVVDMTDDDYCISVDIGVGHCQDTSAMHSRCQRPHAMLQHTATLGRRGDVGVQFPDTSVHSAAKVHKNPGRLLPQIGKSSFARTIQRPFGDVTLGSFPNVGVQFSHQSVRSAAKVHTNPGRLLPQIGNNVGLLQNVSDASASHMLFENGAVGINLAKILERANASISPVVVRNGSAFLRTNKTHHRRGQSSIDVTGLADDSAKPKFRSSPASDSDGNADEVSAESYRRKRNMMIVGGSMVFPIACLLIGSGVFGGHAVATGEAAQDGNDDDYWGAQGRVGVA